VAEGVKSIRVSDNGRYFVDQAGRPFFWLGDTLWELFRAFPPDDARLILRKRRDQGFTVIQAMLTGFNDGKMANAAGVLPWADNDPLKPNEGYFQNVDRVLAWAGELGLIVVLGPYHQMHKTSLTVGNVRGYARWVSRRYAGLTHVVWTMYPEAKDEYMPVIREIVAGLREGDGGAHLITMHPDPSPASSSFLHGEPWLAFNQIQPWKNYDLQYPMVRADYARKPAKPVIMAEGGYEGLHYDTVHTPWHIRKQAWWACLAGGFPTYGHAFSHHRPPDTWREWIDAPGALQMGVCRRVLTGLDRWWTLAPDDSLLSAGERSGLQRNVAARSPDAGWALVYFAEPGEVTIRLHAVAGGAPVNGTWIDPATGTATPAGTLGSGERSVKSPEGGEDALLLLQAGPSA
jgi:hypothetical protein